MQWPFYRRKRPQMDSQRFTKFAATKALDTFN